MPKLTVDLNVSDEELYQLASYHYLRLSESGKNKGKGFTQHFDFVDEHITARAVNEIAQAAAEEASR